MKLNYSFPDEFPNDAKDLIQSLLKEDPSQRLGVEEQGGFEKLKAHKFFENIQWENFIEQEAPEPTSNDQKVSLK